jgi:dTDP-4-amino-4,6-dideoxygalactose transaminase
VILEGRHLIAGAKKRTTPLPFAELDIDEDDVAAVAEVLRSGWVMTGPKVCEFETEFARRLGAKYAVATISGTAALHLAFAAIGLKPGDEVIVPTMTFTATAEAVHYCGASVALVDVMADTLCLDPVAAARAITPRTKAIVPVHLGGQIADMEAIIDLATQHGLIVIDDAAHASPPPPSAPPAGKLGHLAAYSFRATKPITTVDGGMVITNDGVWASQIRKMAHFGVDKSSWERHRGAQSWLYDVVSPGFKYGMPDTAAAMGLAQLRKADRMWERRQAIASSYTTAFRDAPELQVPYASPEVAHSWYLYILRLKAERLSIDRDRFIEELKRRDITAGVHFIPLHRLTRHREMYGLDDAHFPVATHEFGRMLSLPIFSKMSDADIEDVVGAVLDVVHTFRV